MDVLLSSMRYQKRKKKHSVSVRKISVLLSPLPLHRGSFSNQKKKNKNTQTHFACIMQMPFVLSQLSSKLLFSFRCLFIRIDDVVRVGSVPARNSIRICTCKIWFWFSIAVYSSFTVISAVIRTGIICEWQIKRRFSLSRSIDERSRLTENKRQTKLTHLLNVLSVFFFKSFVK